MPESPASPDAVPSLAPILSRPMTRLAVASAAGLFLELAVIRWGGAHVLYLSYVANFVLLTAFLGLGLGCLLAGRMPAERVSRLIAAAPGLLALAVVLVSVLEIEVIVDGPQAVFFHNEHSALQTPAWVTLPLIGLCFAALFTAIGAAVGREMGAASRLKAYSVDVAGSLAGIALFTTASFAGLRAELWFAAGAIALLLLGPRNRMFLIANALLALVTIGVVAHADAGSVWSPYYRIAVLDRGPAKPRVPGDVTAGTPEYRLRVNDITHQYISDIRRREPFYEFPYRALGARHTGPHPEAYLVDPNPKDGPSDLAPAPAAPIGRVLIVGAGTGSDIAFALAYGAQHVDAVEIDPELAAIGRQRHPNHPYDDPRVSLHIGDARAFLERVAQPYDLILFGLPDSLTLASPYAGLRLESFLFTTGCFSRVRAALEPKHGLFVAYNYYREPWLVGRIAAAIAVGFGHKPVVLVGPDKNLSAAFFAGPGRGSVPPELGKVWGFRNEQMPDAYLAKARVPTDDWPFPYLKRPSIPGHLAGSMAVLVLFSLGAVALALRLTRAPGVSTASTIALVRRIAPFFFMGAAFLLLETAGLVRMSLLFGTTWIVNALVFFAVLTMVLFANLLASRWQLADRRLPFVLLGLALLAAWALPPSLLVGLQPWARYAAASVVLFAPVLFANLLFSRFFRDSADAAPAFGANLVGAVVGGALEYGSLLLGYRALLVLAALLYGLAALAAWDAERRGATAA